MKIYAILLLTSQLIVVRAITMTNFAELGTTRARSGEEIFKRRSRRDMLKENFRRNLPELMKRFGYTQASLGKALGVHRAVVNSWISGRQMISYELAERLAVLFELPDPSLLYANSLEPLQLFHSEEEAIKYLAEKAAERKKKD